MKLSVVVIIVATVGREGSVVDLSVVELETGLSENNITVKLASHTISNNLRVCKKPEHHAM